MSFVEIGLSVTLDSSKILFPKILEKGLKADSCSCLCETVYLSPFEKSLLPGCQSDYSGKNTILTATVFKLTLEFN